MTRDELLTAVVEAARENRDAQTITAMNTARDKMIAALSAIDAIDAHRPEMVREMVEVRVHVRLAPGCSAYIVSGMGDLNEAWTDPMPGTAFATLTARVPLPVIPTIPAKVVT